MKALKDKDGNEIHYDSSVGQGKPNRHNNTVLNLKYALYVFAIAAIIALVILKIAE